MKLSEIKLAVIGLGYVGLPLAAEFGNLINVVGYDIDNTRIEELKGGHDRTNELTSEDIQRSKGLDFTNDIHKLIGCNFYIITVPTPVDIHKKPDLSPLKLASQLVGSVMQRGAVVVYESTVYPGATEEICVPILEEASGLIFNRDFYCGYSPERINPGDKFHKIRDIAKLVSGSTDEVAELVNQLYQKIIVAGTHKVSSIKVAEAAKVIENTQRDVNIALINELALIFNRLEIDTEEVLKAAGTKWNFQKYQPGLVGGHCIGVDPYYLTYKAESIGYRPEMILAGRRINDFMGFYVASQLVKKLNKTFGFRSDFKVLIMGFTFKENCPDVRNTKVIDIYKELRQFNIAVDLFDPWVDVTFVNREYGLEVMTQEPGCNEYDAIIIAVAHDKFKELGSMGIKKFAKKESVIYDLKYLLPKSESSMRL